MLGFPVMDEQMNVAYRLEKLGIAKTVPKGSDASLIYDYVTEMVDLDSPYQLKIKDVMRELEFEETRGSQGMDYWASYFASHGQLHHFNPIHAESWRVT